jgi:hypothetical protein
MLAQANISQVKTSPTGTWTIASAKSTTGTPYSGTVQIHPMGKIYTMSWLTTIGDYCGLAFVEDGYIFAGCAFDDNYGVTLYKINPDGTLDGKWISPSNQGVIDSETAVNGTPGQLEGTYKINGTSIKSGNYQGDLKIIQLDETYQVTWSTGIEYQGVGLRTQDWLIVCWGGGNLFTLAYEIQGYKARGRWARFGKSSLGEEILEKIC